MSPPPGDRPAATGSAGSNDRVSAARTNSRTAIAAFEAVCGYAKAEDLPSDALPAIARRDPAHDHARLARTLCALRHLTDQFGALSFGDRVRAANELYQQQCAGFGRHAMVLHTRMAEDAVGTCERSLTAPRPRHRGFWPPDTLSYLRGYVSSHGLSFEPSATSLMTGLLADLRHYADHQGIDFQEALAAGIQEHVRMRLRAEGPFETGQTPRQLPAPEPQPFVTASFQPTATNQGVVVSPADTEFLLIRTAARSQDRWQQGLPADRRDADDERVLAEALAKIHGQATEEIFTSLAPEIAARIRQIEDGPASAAELGRDHGRTGTPPYCDLEIDGDANVLLHALGETERMTDANHPYRVSLVTAYAEAYQVAAGNSLPPADSPARIAARDFPRLNPAAGASSFPDPGRPAQASPQTPQHGPRSGAH